MIIAAYVLTRPISLNCEKSGPIIATGGKKAIARIRVINGLLNRNLNRAMAYAATEPKTRHTIVVVPAITALFKSERKKPASAKIAA
jgi:hypothetical protein